MMKPLILVTAFLLMSSSMAKTIRLMSFFRTNYYTHKTYVFDAEVNAKCELVGSRPLSSYFVVQTNQGAKAEALSGNNKKLFSPKLIVKSPREALFSLGIFSHELFTGTYPHDVKFKAVIYPTSNGCEASVESYIDNQLANDDLNRIEAELILHKSGLLKGHPKGLSWLKFMEPGSSSCLVGHCR